MAAFGIMLFATATSTRSFAQSTEGKDFWVTFLKADSYDSDDKKIELSLTISAKNACEVTIENTYSGYRKTISLAAGELKEHLLYTGTAKPAARTNDAVKCYSFNSEKVDTTAIHVTATDSISLFASNWKDKSFDATNVLPTDILQDYYLIQSYPPSAHSDTQQGTHFAIVATEDNTIVDYCPTVKTTGHRTNDTVTTPPLKKGQVWYVWTGVGGGDNFDLSGTWVKARDGKHIAVFQGAPHTNIPSKIRDRDHIFSQAMPTIYWGNTFAITASQTRKRDKIRVMAIYDGTEVYVNGKLVHTFDFTNDNVASAPEKAVNYPKGKRTFEFELGDKVVSCTDSKNKFTLEEPLAEGKSCLITTSCPAAVHLFMVSNRYDDTEYGDPAMLWVNPIEQKIDHITFATYKSDNTHYFNAVTDKKGVASMKLDGVDISADFIPVEGSNEEYYYCSKNITHDTHTLTGDSGFIAHVYGYGERESYGYNAGGAARPLNLQVKIQDQTYTPGFPLELCGDGETPIKFSVDLSDPTLVTKIVWNFGDGSNEVYDVTSCEHLYPAEGVYDKAFLVVKQKNAQVCRGEGFGNDTIPLSITISSLNLTIDSITGILCYTDTFRLYYHNKGAFSLEDLGVTVTYDPLAEWGFERQDLKYTEEYIEFVLPQSDTRAHEYKGKSLGHLYFASKCNADTIDQFVLNNIGKLDVVVDSIDDMICNNNTMKIYYRNLTGVSLIDEECTVTYDELATKNGFQSEQLQYTDEYFQIQIPDEANAGLEYALEVNMITECSAEPEKARVPFIINYKPFEVMAQRWDNILAVMNEKTIRSIQDKQGDTEYYNIGDLDFVGYQWYYNNQILENDTTSQLDLKDHPEISGGEFFVCLVNAQGDSLCSCPVQFQAPPTEMKFSDDMKVTPFTAANGTNVWITTDKAATAEWIRIDGTYEEKEIAIPEGGCLIEAPKEQGLYLLRIETEEKTKSFKIMVH